MKIETLEKEVILKERIELLSAELDLLEKSDCYDSFKIGNSSKWLYAFKLTPEEFDLIKSKRIEILIAEIKHLEHQFKIL